MDADTEKTAKPRRRWLRFSLRTLLIVVTVLSIPLTWVGWRLREVRREQATITWVEKMGGEVYFRSSVVEADEISWWEGSTDKWFGQRVWRVDLSTTQVSDLSPLAKLKSLRTLVLRNTQESDLSPLAELKNFKALYLENPQVSNLSPLAELKNLEYLTLYRTQVSDLSPLAELKSLKSLYLRNTPVSDEQVQELRQALPNCKIKHSIRVEE